MSSTEESDASDSDISSTYHSDSELLCCLTHITEDISNTAEEDKCNELVSESVEGGNSLDSGSLDRGSESDISSTYHSDTELKCCKTYVVDLPDIEDFAFTSMFTVYRINNEDDQDIIEDQDILLDIFSDIKSLNLYIGYQAEIVSVDPPLIGWTVQSQEAFDQLIRCIEQNDLKRTITDFAKSKGMEEKLKFEPGVSIDIDVVLQDPRRLKLKAKKHFQDQIYPCQMKTVMETPEERRTQQLVEMKIKHVTFDDDFVDGEDDNEDSTEMEDSNGNDEIITEQTDRMETLSFCSKGDSDEQTCFLSTITVSDVIDCVHDAYRQDLPKMARVTISQGVKFARTKDLKELVAALSKYAEVLLSDADSDPEKQLSTQLKDPSLWPKGIIPNVRAVHENSGEVEEVELLPPSIRVKHIFQTAMYYNTVIKKRHRRCKNGGSEGKRKEKRNKKWRHL